LKPPPMLRSNLQRRRMANKMNKPEATAPGTRALRLSEVVELPEFQIRSSTDPRTVTKYARAMQNGATFPPITVAQINGAYAVVDGWHRLSATRSVGAVEIDATIVPCSGIEEARWMAAQANLTHGLPLKLGAKREVFRAYVKAGKHRKGKGRVKSSRDIAAELQGMVAHATVLMWMGKDFPAVYRQMRGSEESPKGKGGLPERSPDESLTAHIQGAVEQALASFRGVKDAEVRGQIIGQWRAALRDMEEAGEWTEPPPEDEDDF
jgi:hypothetical protein